MTERDRLRSLADRYRIERELGAGGMATVYLAHDVRHDRKVALKVLRPDLAAVIGGARFLAEIRTTANLQHPHILPLHDSGEVDGSVFYVMPYVDGESLRDRLRREKQLPIDEAIRIAREVAGALHYAHGHGVIHRDIKPENILLQGGHAMVADFGIALAASATAGTRMTETGMSLGTPTYMSPEQAMGERDITARSDVYALGCVLYEMLLGEPPFTGPTAQSIVAKVLSERPAPMRLRRDRIPPAVESAVMIALEKLPADRFATLAEFSSALTAPVSATAASMAVPATRAKYGSRVMFAGGALAGFLATGIVAWLLRSPPAETGVSISTQLTFNGRSINPAISPDGDFVAFTEQRCRLDSEVACDHSLKVQATSNGRPVEILRGRGFGRPRWTSDGQSLVVRAELDSVRHSLFLVPRLGGMPNAVGPVGPFDLHASADSLVVLTHDPQSRELIARFGPLPNATIADTVSLGRRQAHGVSWSPDGRYLALVRNFAGVTIFTREGEAVDSATGFFRSTVRWTPDGEGILVFMALPVKEDLLLRYDVARDGRLGAASIVMPKVAAILRGDFDVSSRSGRLVMVTGVLNQDLWTFELGAGGASQRVSGTTWYGHPAITPDGSRLYYQRGDALGDNLYSLILPDSEEVLTSERFGAGFLTVRVSRDQRRVLFARGSESVSLGEFDVARRQARYVQWGSRSTDSPQFIGGRGLVWSPPDEWNLVTADSLGGPERSALPDDSIWVDQLADGPNGSEVAAIARRRGGQRTLGIVSLATGTMRNLHQLEPGVVYGSLSWADDGWIYVATHRNPSDLPVLWRIRDGQSSMSRVTTLPQGCQVRSTVVAIRAPRGACKRDDARGDVWLVDVPGLRR